MSGYVLCQVKKAERPYYIENISTNIYSIEELCFYLYNNIYLLDSTILGEELCFWIRDELGLKKLAAKLYALLDQEPVKAGDFILPIFKEINYLSLEEFRKLNQRIQRLAQEPEALRQKMKGDYLMEHNKYVNAIRIYQKALGVRLSEQEEKQLGSQFAGEIYHNMGCAYVRLFQMEEAETCFEKAYEYLHTMTVIRSLLCALYMEKGQEAFEKRAEELGLQEAQKEQLLDQIRREEQQLYDTSEGRKVRQAMEKKAEGKPEEYRKMMEEILKQLAGEYHRSTGY